MNKIYIIAVLLFSIPLFSQTIKGTVYDENKQTIAGANVYLDGTSLWTITDDQGNYELRPANKINTVLVIGFIGYESVSIANPFENAIHKTYLVPKETSLKEVNVISDGFKRADKLRIFREQFLGTTKAGRSCKILNEDAIVFQYDLKLNRLIASSQVPLHIRNAYLGYETEFTLVDFYIEFTRKSISSLDVNSSLFAGTTFYKDLGNPKKSYTKQRKKTYEGSQKQFFRNLTLKVWNRKNFQLFDGSYPCNPDDSFTVARQSDGFEITVRNPEPAKSSKTLKKDTFLQSFNILYNAKEQSAVTFKIQKFNVDNFGNFDSYAFILFGGEMSRQRAGDLLPLDFQQ